MQNPAICSACGGACCKASGGHIFPDEFKKEINFEFLFALLSTGLYAVDWWGSPPEENDSNSSRLYFIRYKHQNTPGLLDNSRFRPCIMLTGTGCRLDYQERPLVCRSLIPKENFRCTFEDDKFSIENCAIGWMPYQELIKKCLNIIGPDVI